MKRSVVLLSVVTAAFACGLQAQVLAQAAAASAPSPAAQAAAPIAGLAQVTFKTSDMKKARAYYEGVLGLPQAFTVKDSAGVTSAYFKVNDDQYVEITPTLKPGELVRQARVVFQSTDLKALHALYAERG